MKALRLFALLLVLVGVVASASAHSFVITGPLCGSSNDPTLCDQTTGEDIGCSSFCDATCTGYTNVNSNCVVRFAGGYTCRCTGQIGP